MRILQLNVNGISGSTGKIVSDIKSVLESHGHECLICYGANDKIENSGYKKICYESERKFNAAISKITGIKHGDFFPFSFYRLKRIIKNWNPDVIHIHCPNGYILDLFKTLEFLSKSNAKVVLTNHAEYWYTGGCGHSHSCSKFLTECTKCDVVKGYLGLNAANIEWRNFRKAYQSFNPGNIIVTSVSPWVEKRARNSASMEGLHQITVLNGIDTNIFKIRNISEDSRLKIPKGKPIALHVTAEFTTEENSIKGGYWIKKLAKLNPDINFIVACTFIGIIKDLPSNVYIWGRTKNQKELAELYNASNITVLTSKKETFSMIVAESLCCGTPIVGFKAGGPESIGVENFSSFYDQGNLKDLNEGLINKLYMKNGIEEIISKEAIAKYDKFVMVNNYERLYNELLNNNIPVD